MHDTLINLTFLAQLLGGLGLLINIVSLQLKNARHIVLCDIPGALIWAAHLALLGGMTGAFMCCIAALRSSLACITPQHFQCYAMAFILCAIWLMGLTQAESLLDLLPCVGGSLLTLTFFLARSRRIIARGILIMTLLWLAYAFLTSSTPLMISCVINITSCVIGMARYEGWFKSVQPTIQAAE